MSESIDAGSRTSCTAGRAADARNFRHAIDLRHPVASYPPNIFGRTSGIRPESMIARSSLRHAAELFCCGSVAFRRRNDRLRALDHLFVGDPHAGVFEAIRGPVTNMLALPSSTQRDRAKTGITSRAKSDTDSCISEARGHKANWPRNSRSRLRSSERTNSARRRRTGDCLTWLHRSNSAAGHGRYLNRACAPCR